MLFRSKEGAAFSHITSLIDHANQQGGTAGDTDADPSGRQPAFFSGNIASLSQMFQGVGSERITVRDLVTKVTQTVTYQWK